MATVTPLITGGRPLGSPPRGTVIVEWNLPASGDDGDWVELPQFPDKSVMVTGTFGTTTVTIQGTNEADKTNPQTLNDPQGTALTFTSARIEQILENPRFIRPIASAGNGTNFKITMTCVRTRVPRQG
jgi:hypothetical protein